MSFTPEQAIKALKMNYNNIERAVDWIFAHPGDVHHELTMRPVEVVFKSTGHPVIALFFLNNIFFLKL